MFNSVLKYGKSLIDSGLELANEGVQQLLHKKVKVAITGLSQSGKSMLFTSLLTLIKDRAAQKQVDFLPLLKELPLDRIRYAEVRAIENEKMFPLEPSQEALAKGEWPEVTEDVYGFELFIELTREQGDWLVPLSHIQTLSLQFYDYPGEWLTDLPMLQMDFIAWNHKTLAQQTNNPQKKFSGSWQQFLETFDFDQPPTPERIDLLLSQYKLFLQQTKSAGITVLQPATLLLKSASFDWQQYGFTPLPTDVSSDLNHPWTKCFIEHFNLYQNKVLKPLQKSYFTNTDKQIILIDLFEGLSYGQSHLKQLRETITLFAGLFVYGKTHWLSEKLMGQHKISDLAFVASKVDSAPLSQQPNLLSLLIDVTKGARAALADQPVHFEHFLLSAIQAAENDPIDEKDVIYYYNSHQALIRKTFHHPIPSSIGAMDDNQSFMLLKNSPGSDYLTALYRAQGIDTLLNFILEESDNA